MLFRPFRFGLWARLAVVALITGEAGGIGGGSSIPNLNNNRGGGDQLAGAARLFTRPSWEQIQPYAGWIALGLAVGLALLLLWIYSDCVYRFILLDTVVSGQCRLREGWRRWREAGRRYFVWVIAFGFGSFAVVGVMAGIPAWLAYRAGWFEKPEENLGALIGGGILLGLLVIAIVACSCESSTCLARDFLIPVMAFEDVGAMDGWERLLAIMGAEKSAYAVYVLMKIVLAMGSGIIFAIINLIVILVLLIPLGLLGLAAYFVGSGLGIAWDLSTELLVAAVGLLALAGILYVVGFVYAPGLVFFQSYTLEFFAPRVWATWGTECFLPESAATPPAPPLPSTAPMAPADVFPA